MHKIDEICDLGAHANLIVPPSWVVKLPPKRVSISKHLNNFHCHYALASELIFLGFIIIIIIIIIINP